MAEERMQVASRPAGEASAHCAVGVYRSGDRIQTASGFRRVEGLRPGDRVLSDELGTEVPVLWVAMSRRGASDAPIFRVMMGRDAATRSVSAPVAGRVSSRTGRFSLDRNALNGCAGDTLH